MYIVSTLCFNTPAKPVAARVPAHFGNKKTGVKKPRSVVVVTGFDSH